jgi:soluble P-type ATPase
MDCIPLEKQEKTIVFVLYSIHNVMKAEKVLRSQGILFDTIPVPREISADCGMAILVARGDRQKVLKILAESRINVKDVYLRKCGKYEKENDR